MRFEIEDINAEIFVNGKSIILYELSSIDLFSKNEVELDSLMKQFQEFFHALKDIRIQIIVKSRQLNSTDIKDHLALLSSDNGPAAIYIEDLLSLIENNSIPFKKYFLVISNFKSSDKAFVDSLKARLIQIGFSIRQIKHKELIKIAREIFND